MVASGASGSVAVTVYWSRAFTSTHQPSPATMKPRSRICGSPVEGQYTSDTMPCPTVAHTRAEPSDVVTTSFGAAARNGPTGCTGDGAPDVINTPCCRTAGDSLNALRRSALRPSPGGPPPIPSESGLDLVGGVVQHGRVVGGQLSSSPSRRGSSVQPAERSVGNASFPTSTKRSVASGSSQVRPGSASPQRPVRRSRRRSFVHQHWRRSGCGVAPENTMRR